MRNLALLCTLFLGTGLVLAQTGAEAGNASATAIVGVPGTPGDAPAPLQGYMAQDLDAGYVEGGTITDAGRAGEDCPAGSICGQDVGACQPANVQWYFYSDLEFCTPPACQRVRCENFPPPGVTINKPIGIISWRGVYIDDGSNGCVKDVHNFRIRFYQDAGGAPANPLTGVYTENLVASAVDTGDTVSFGGAGAATVWQFTAVLTTPQALTTGWFSIAGYGEPGCYHLWQGSPEGDNKFYQWYEVNGTVPGPAVTTNCDLGYCFGEKKIGACCDDCTGICEEGVPELLCLAAGGRFLLNGTCGALNPVCGEALGACCQDDGTCTLARCRKDAQHPTGCLEDEQPPQPCLGDMNCDGMIDFADINPFVLYLSNNAAWQAAYPNCPVKHGDINNDDNFPAFSDINPFVALMSTGQGPCPTAPRLQGAVWLGAGTVCTDCCTVIVPPGANLENEPNDCELGSVFNGGCNNFPDNPPQFSPLGAAPYTVYGESWADNNARDTDWYEFTLSEAAQIVWTVNAEFDPLLFIMAAGDCDTTLPTTYYTLASGAGVKCTDFALTTLVYPPGTYWLFVSPATFDGVPCKADYKATVSIVPGELCSITCPTDPVPFHEAETCGQDPDLNAGCNATPPVFETIPIGGGGVYGVCGTLFAFNGTRDLDWFQFTISSPKTVTIKNVQSEIPLLLTPLVDSTGVGPPPNCDDYYYYPGLHWTQCEPVEGNEVSFTFDTGTYWLLVAPSTYDGTNVTPIFDGFPCNGPYQDYYFELELPECLTPCADLGGGNPEGEGNCVFPDNFNSGCNGNNTFTVLPLNTAICGTTGTSGANKDYDWYKFTLTANSRIREMYLYSNAQMTWEIWPATAGGLPDCAAGWREGLDVPQCYSADDLAFIDCYQAGTYFLKVYPTSEAPCGTEYYLALFNAGGCTFPCNVTCTTTIDDPCDDVNDFDTNAGCDVDDPNQSMNFQTAAAYCGRVYAGLQNGTKGYYDPDWFTVKPPTGRTKVQLQANADFAYALEVYATCAAYDAGTPLGSVRSTTGTPPYEAACITKTLIVTGLTSNTVYLGLIYPIDHLGDIAKYYFPCAFDNNYTITVSYPF